MIPLVKNKTILVLLVLGVVSNHAMGRPKEPIYHPNIEREDPFENYVDKEGRNCCSKTDCIGADMCFFRRQHKLVVGWWEEGSCREIPEDRIIPAPKESCNWVSERGYEAIVCRKIKRDSRNSPSYEVVCAFPCVSN